MKDDDTCLFGAEINVVNAATPKTEIISLKTISQVNNRPEHGSKTLSHVMDPDGSKTFKWKIKDVYNSRELCHQSEYYEVEGVRWYLFNYICSFFYSIFNYGMYP